jgi:arylsulfatase
MQTLFDEEARKNDVYPMGAGSGSGPSEGTRDRKEFAFHQGFPGIWTWENGPDFERSHRITAGLIVPKEGVQGVIIAAGTRDGGFTLYVKDQRVIYERVISEKNNILYKRRTLIVSSELLPTGKVEIVYEFARRASQTDSMDRGQLYLNGQLVGEGEFPSTAFVGADTLDIGMNSPSPVSEAYEAPFTFTGILTQVKVELQ